MLDRGSGPFLEFVEVARDKELWIVLVGKIMNRDDASTKGIGREIVGGIPKDVVLARQRECER
jgi:hypothetical protein